jgi:uracil-DNA glycosylase family 4
MSLANLKELYDRYRDDPNFDHMRYDDINFVPGTGVLKPKAMFIGEAPGVDENARCIPFVGNAGTELRKLLKKAGIDQASLYFTNVVKYWPRRPNRSPRPPTEQEVEDSRDYLLKEIEIVEPAFVAMCGRIATRAIFPNIMSVRAVNGKLFNKKYVPLLHPAVVLYKREQYEEVLGGYKTLATLIDTLN